MIDFVKLVKRGNKLKILFLSKYHFHLKTFRTITSYLFGLTRKTSVSGKRYGLVIVDDYSRWT